MFSVIIPVYNKANTLPTTLASVLSQTFQPQEIIVVDDGSKDDFEGAVAPFLSDRRVRVIRQPNGGVSVARNTGAAAASAPFLCYLDADDTWYPNHLQTLRSMVERYPGNGLYCTAYDVIHPDGTQKDTKAMFLSPGTFAVPDFFAYTERLSGRYFLHVVASCVSREAAFEVGGFEPGVRIGEDTDFLIRVAAYHGAVFDGTVTAAYHRELSTATRNGLLNYDWVFEKREAAMMADERVSPSEKAFLFLFLERFRIHKCRHYLMEGNRAQARAVFRGLSREPALRGERLKTWVMMRMPSALLRRMYAAKKANQ